MNKDDFYYYLNSELGINLSDEQKEQLSIFAMTLIDYNKHTNITAITDINQVYLKHFYDSLTIIKVCNLNENITVLDIGSGGGFPGLVLGIVFPNLRITLLDSNHKKTNFQNFIINKLGLLNISTINNRAEIYYKSGNKYDLVVARAVANLTILSELCIPFVNNNGLFVAMKGTLLEELNDAEYAINFLGGMVESSYQFNLPILMDGRTLIKIRKIKESPEGYPRIYDRIIKKPIKRK